MADGGYDVADYCDIDPRFGTLADADALLAEAHALGLRVIVDLVANHTSEQHPWFAAALAAGRARPSGTGTSSATAGPGERSRPTTGSAPSAAAAWTRVREPDGRRGSGTCTCSRPQQPDLDWDHPGVQEDFDAVLRFWFDRGVDGIRVDAAPAMAKVPGLPDAGHEPGPLFESRTGSATRTGTSTRCTTSSGAGGGSGTPTTATGCSSPRRWSTARSG